MKKNNLFFLLVLILGASCTKKNPETLITKWKEKIKKESALERAMASEPDGKNLLSLFKVKILKDEIKELEANFSAGTRVRGSWRHLDLGSLPIPQANFLKTYGEKIGDLKNPDSIDYSGCDDVPCIYNKIYGKGDHIAGYVHYIWYLKFGHMLSADNLVPDQKAKEAGIYNGKAHSLNDYLYNEKELFGLWRLSHMLKAPHTTITRLIEVQRIPRLEKIENQAETTCGVASYTGWILLNDACLTIYNAEQDVGYLYQAVTHELNHQLDWEEGKAKEARLLYRSSLQDFLDVSGMYLVKDFVNEKNFLITEWGIHPDAKLPNDYAKNSPAENFAESLAIFRVEGDKLRKAVTNEHFSFVSNNFYHGQSFELDALFKMWLTDYMSDTENEVFKAVLNCSKVTTAPASKYFLLQDFSHPVLPSMLNCMGNSALQISQSLKNKISLYKPDGRIAFSTPEKTKKWEKQVHESLRKSYDRYIIQLQNDKKYLSRIQGFIDQMADNSLATNAYIQCYKEPREKNCFETTLRDVAIEQSLYLMLPAEQTEELANMYASYHTYESIKNETKKNYQIFIASKLELITTSANATWDSCRNNSHNDIYSPTGNMFRIADGYLISSFYNCLNTSIPDAIKQIIAEIEVDGFKIEHEKEEVILTEGILGHYQKILTSFYGFDREVEKEGAFLFIEADKGQLRSKLLNDFDWIKDVTDETKIHSDCLKEAYRNISFEPLYHLKSELFSNLLEKSSCQNISSAQEFNSWVDRSRETLKQKIHLSLEEKILTLGGKKAKECVSRSAMNNIVMNFINKRKNKLCLADAWPGIQEEVISDLLKKPMATKLKLTKEELSQELDSKQTRLQNIVIRNYL